MAAPIFAIKAIVPEALIEAYRTPRMRAAADRANAREADTIVANLTRKTARFSAKNKPKFAILVRGIERDIYTSNEIFRLWNYGSRRHVIRARRAKALHFTWKGKERFFKFVNHPGYKGSHIIEAEAADSRKRYPRVMREEIARNLGR